MAHRPDNWHIKSVEEKGESEKPFHHGQRLFSHYHHHSSPPLTKSMSIDQEEEKAMDSTKTELTEKTELTIEASPVKQRSTKVVPLLRFTKNGQEVVPNSDNAFILTDLSARMVDLEHEGGQSFLKSLNMLLEVYYLTLFLWCQFLWNCACRVVKYQLLALFQLKKVAALVVQFLTGLLLAGIRLFLFGIRLSGKG